MATGDKQRKLTLAEVEALKNRGFNQTEVAEVYGVTRQYVSWIKHTYGGKLTPRESVGREFPFTVQEVFTKSTQYKRLRDHGEYFATGGKGMADYKLKRLGSWYKKLRDEGLVIEFDPDNPPEPGVNKHGGFTYRPRTADDGDLLVRQNEFCHLTENGKMIWRFPPVEP